MENNLANNLVKGASEYSVFSMESLLIIAFLTNIFDKRALLYMMTLLRTL